MRVSIAVAIALSAVGIAATSSAQAAIRRQTNITPQELESALQGFAKERDLQIIFRSTLVKDLHTSGVVGDLTAEETLDRLLGGTGLGHRYLDEKTVMIVPLSGGSSSAPATRGGSSRESSGKQTSSQSQRKGFWSRLRLAQAEAAAATDASGQDGVQETLGNSAGEPQQRIELEEILVTGTRIRGAHPVGANLITLDRETIEESGRTTVQDVLAALPQNFTGSQNEATQEGTLNARSNFTFGSTVDLRGLGADATLTLVNGRRLAPAGTGNFVDISTIPLSAVERIEVLADGASATYGADAVGGVVNIILNRDFDGAETAARYGGATQGGAEEFGFSHLAGFDWSGGQLTAGYDYRRRGDIDIMERAFTATADFRDRGGTNFERINSNPGNITRIGATTVSLAIPTGQDGTSLTEADLISGAPNFTNINRDAWLMPRQESHAVFLSSSQELGPHFEVFADVIAANRQAYSERENLGANLVVPETNAYRVLNNLFPGRGNLIIAYHMGADLGPVTTTTETRAFSGIAGAAFTFDNDWRLEASAALARSDEIIDLGNFFDSATIAPTLASSDLANAFNPFADGSNTNAAVLAGLTFDQHATSRGQTDNLALKADGPLWRLWGGVMRAAFGFERREETFRHSRYEIHNSGISPNPTQAPGSRTIDAIFAELSLPLVSEENGVRLVRNLDLSASARWERASDYGGETTPKIGVAWEVVDGFALRGSWGRSFKGPLFQQLLGGVGLSYLNATAAQDPRADNGSTGVLIVTGANRNLGPERAVSWSAGFEIAPSWASGFRLSASYFDIDFADRVSTPASPFAILANPIGFESIVFRDPSPELVASYLTLATPTGTLPSDGVEVIIDRRNVNLSSQRVRGVDFSAAYFADLPIGEISLNGAVSLLLQHELTVAPGASPVAALNTLNGPVDLRGRAGVNWRRGAWNAVLSVNYVDDYADNISIPARPIDKFVTYDMRAALDWRADPDGKGLQIALNIQNLLDEDPPFVNNSTGYAYDASNASPFGRVITLEVCQRW